MHNLLDNRGTVQYNIKVPCALYVEFPTHTGAED